MMSKRLFFNAMREDLRHKTWMIALSALGSFLAVTVVWLIGWGSEGRYLSGVESQEAEVLGRTLDFFVEYLPMLGAFIAVGAALVTGLAGFGYLFHKNRVDTYDSLPVKRSTLFAVIYVDGILIWLVPFLTFLSIPMVMGTGLAGRAGGAWAAAEILKLTWRGFLVQVTVFLLVYHLVLIAVMLSGNVLNSLVCMLVLGFGVVGIHALVLSFFEYYMNHFYQNAGLATSVTTFLSPLFAAVDFIIIAADGPGDKFGELIWVMFFKLGEALLLGLCAWRLCKRRASELAEQGVQNRGVTAVLRAAVGVAAGMCGWMLFTTIAGYGRTIWGCFGAVFAAVFVFGVMDVIFQMDFKAFFAHKIQMAVVVAVSLAVCFIFLLDLFGYDAYLPEKEDIAELAVYDRAFSSSYADSIQAERGVLETMHFADVDAIYPFLEYGTGHIPWKWKREYTDAGRNYEEVAVRVTLKNGRTYCRSYDVPADREILWPIYTSEEYLKSAYCISDETMENIVGFSLYRGGGRTSVENAQAAAALAQAFNRDVMEHPDDVLSGEGVLLTRVNLVERTVQGGEWFSNTWYVYSGMEHSIEALRQAGYGKWVDVYDASDITAIELPLRETGPDAEPEEILAKAMQVYYGTGGMEPEGMSAERMDAAMEDAIVLLQITDQEEIEELLGCISYYSFNSNNYIRKNYVAVTVVGADGSSQECYIQKGRLPEKYLSRFAEAAGVE